MAGWDAYPREARPRPGLPPSRSIAPAGGMPTRLGDYALGNHFRDATWRDVLRRQGWQETEVRGMPGWVSGPLPGLRLLFAAPELGPGGLDDTPFLLGFRHDDADVDEVWRVVPHGDGELVFDRLSHARASFDRDELLAWLRHESMADATRLPAA